MGGFTGPPDGGAGSLPNIPVPDFSEQAKQLTLGAKLGGLWDDFWKARFEHMITGHSSVWSLVMDVIDDLASIGVNLLTKVQGIGTQGFFNLVSATIGDLLGFEVDESKIQAAFQQTGQYGAVRAIGTQLLSTLVGEMQSDQQITPQSGYNAAAAWLGYVTEFAVRQGNVEMVTEMLPSELRFFEGLRGYGVNLAHVLGLSRLTREALRSVMKCLVGDPITWYFNQLYRPKMLSEGSMIRANMRGGMTDSDMNTYLQWLGYRDQDIPQLILDAQTLPTIDAYVAMQRTGFQEPDILEDRLAEAGIPASRQQEYLDGITARRCETRLNEAVNAYLRLARNRWLSTDDLRTQLSQLGLTDKEIYWCLATISPDLEYTTKELSFAEVENAYIAGLVSISYVSDWATRQGYSATDSQVLQYQLLLKQKKETTAETLASWRLKIACLEDTAKGYPPPPGFDKSCNPTTT